MHDDARGPRFPTAPVDFFPVRRPFWVSQPCDSARDQLVRYFAWGFLSRREVTELLRQLDQRAAGRHIAAA